MPFLQWCIFLLLIGVPTAVHSMKLEELVMDVSFKVLSNRHLIDYALQQKLEHAKAIYNAREKSRKVSVEQQKLFFVSTMVEAMLNLSRKGEVEHLFDIELKNKETQLKLQHREFEEKERRDDWEVVPKTTIETFKQFFEKNKISSDLKEAGEGELDKVNHIALTLKNRASRVHAGKDFVDILVLFYKLCIQLTGGDNDASYSSSSSSSPKKYGRSKSQGSSLGSPKIAGSKSPKGSNQRQAQAQPKMVDHREAQWWLNQLASYIDSILRCIEFVTQNPFLLGNYNDESDQFSVFDMFRGQYQQYSAGQHSGDDHQSVADQGLLSNFQHDEWFKEPESPNKPKQSVDDDDDDDDDDQEGDDGPTQGKLLPSPGGGPRQTPSNRDWIGQIPPLLRGVQLHEIYEPESKKTTVGDVAGQSSGGQIHQPSNAGPKTLSDSVESDWETIEPEEQPETKPKSKKSAGDGGGAGQSSGSQKDRGFRRSKTMGK